MSGDGAVSGRITGYLVTWLLSFRDKVLLIEPEEIRTELCSELQNTLQQYRRWVKNDLQF